MNPVVLPTLESPCIRVRQLGAADVPALFALYSDARVMRFWSHAPFRSIDQAEWYLRDIDAGRIHGSHYQWGIALRSDDRVIGTVTLFAFDRARRCAEVAYALACDHWRQGHARDAVRLIIDDAFERMAMGRVEANADARNVPSCSLLRRLGFVQCATSNDAEPNDHVLRFTITRHALQSARRLQRTICSGR